jgi:hypothetical protein
MTARPSNPLRQAAALKANGIVGVTINMKITSGPTIRFTALGTAIATPRTAPSTPPKPPVMTVQLGAQTHAIDFPGGRRRRT